MEQLTLQQRLEARAQFHGCTVREKQYQALGYGLLILEAPAGQVLDSVGTHSTWCPWGNRGGTKNGARRVLLERLGGGVTACTDPCCAEYREQERVEAEQLPGTCENKDHGSR